MSEGQRKALERYPEARYHLHWFAVAQGYAACYNEIVVPMLRVSAAKGLEECVEATPPEVLTIEEHQEKMRAMLLEIRGITMVRLNEATGDYEIIEAGLVIQHINEVAAKHGVTLTT